MKIKTPRTSRREFLKAGFAGIAGASILTRCSGDRTNPGNQPEDRKIVFRTLGRTGLRLPVVSKKPPKALETLRGWSSAGLACRDCAACTVRCALGFDVQSRALELARVLET